MSVVAGSTVLCTQPRRRTFGFDAVLDEQATQEHMFQSELQPERSA